jgi:hypothetical protein
MTDDDRRVWLMTWCEDLAYKTDAELAYGCARYRRDKENKFFPTPGQLLEACKNPYDSGPGRRYDPLPPLPEITRTPEQLQELIQNTYKKANYFPHEKTGNPSLESIKAEILARPPTPVVPMTPERKKELLDTAARRIASADAGLYES